MGTTTFNVAPNAKFNWNHLTVFQKWNILLFTETGTPRPFAFTQGIFCKHAYNFSSATDCVEINVYSLVNSVVQSFGAINVRVNGLYNETKRASCLLSLCMILVCITTARSRLSGSIREIQLLEVFVIESSRPWKFSTWLVKLPDDGMTHYSYRVTRGQS
jgi:hypothetical protein